MNEILNDPRVRKLAQENHLYQELINKNNQLIAYLVKEKKQEETDATPEAV